MFKTAEDVLDLGHIRVIRIIQQNLFLFLLRLIVRHLQKTKKVEQPAEQTHSHILSN